MGDPEDGTSKTPAITFNRHQNWFSQALSKDDWDRCEWGGNLWIFQKYQEWHIYTINTIQHIHIHIHTHIYVYIYIFVIRKYPRVVSAAFAGYLRRICEKGKQIRTNQNFASFPTQTLIITIAIVAKGAILRRKNNIVGFAGTVHIIVCLSIFFLRNQLHYLIIWDLNQNTFFCIVMCSS